MAPHEIDPQIITDNLKLVLKKKEILNDLPSTIQEWHNESRTYLLHPDQFTTDLMGKDIWRDCKEDLDNYPPIENNRFPDWFRLNEKIVKLIAEQDETIQALDPSFRTPNDNKYISNILRNWEKGGANIPFLRNSFLFMISSRCHVILTKFAEMNFHKSMTRYEKVKKVLKFQGDNLPPFLPGGRTLADIMNPIESGYSKLETYIRSARDKLSDSLDFFRREPGRPTDHWFWFNFVLIKKELEHNMDSVPWKEFVGLFYPLFPSLKVIGNTDAFSVKYNLYMREPMKEFILEEFSRFKNTNNKLLLPTGWIITKGSKKISITRTEVRLPKGKKFNKKPNINIEFDY